MPEKSLISDPGKFTGVGQPRYFPDLPERSITTELSPLMSTYGPYLLYESHERAGRTLPVTRSSLRCLATICTGITLLLSGYAVGQYMADSKAAADAVERAAKTVPLKGTIIGNYDGDTVTVAINVRLAEIDAPELRQEYGKESKAVLASLLPPKTAVLIRQDTVDRYGRMVAHISHSAKAPSAAVDITASYRMVLKGAAWQYSDYSQDKNLTNAQTFASDNGFGLWGTDLSPLPPWEFRKRPTIKREVLPFPGNLPENPFQPIPQSAPAINGGP